MQKHYSTCGILEIMLFGHTVAAHIQFQHIYPIYLRYGNGNITLQKLVLGVMHADRAGLPEYPMGDRQEDSKANQGKKQTKAELQDAEDRLVAQFVPNFEWHTFRRAANELEVSFHQRSAPLKVVKYIS